MTGETVRQRIREVLLSGPATAKDVSRRAGVAEHDVEAHLRHIERSARHHGERLVIEPAACFACGFEFRQRRRLSRPGRCPRCASRRISLPRFHLEPRRRS